MFHVLVAPQQTVFIFILCQPNYVTKEEFSLQILRRTIKVFYTACLSPGVWTSRGDGHGDGGA